MISINLFRNIIQNLQPCRRYVKDVGNIHTLYSCTRNLYTPSLLKKLTNNNFLHHDKCHLQLIRTFAKGKDKKKEKGKVKVTINEFQIAELLNVDSIKTQMEHAVDNLKHDFIKHLSLRSATGSIESLVIKLDGEEHTLQELAQINRKNPKMVVLNMATFPQALPEVLKVLQGSGLNLNPQQDGTTLYIPIPKVTKEHRENLSKNAKQFFVKCKEIIRDVQIRYSKTLKKKEGVSEDLIRSVEQQLKALADKYIAEGEKILESKQKELLGS